MNIRHLTLCVALNIKILVVINFTPFIYSFIILVTKTKGFQNSFWYFIENIFKNFNFNIFCIYSRLAKLYFIVDFYFFNRYHDIIIMTVLNWVWSYKIHCDFINCKIWKIFSFSILLYWHVSHSFWYILRFSDWFVVRIKYRA